MARKLKGRKVDELNDLASHARVLGEELRQVQRAEAQVKQSHEERLWWLKDRLMDGKWTTGDPILDVKIMAWENAERDDVYQRLVDFQEVLASHSGELVASARYNLRDEYSIEHLGLLPLTPQIAFTRWSGAYAHERRRHKAQATVPLEKHVQYSGTPEEGGEFRLYHAYFEKGEGPVGILFEDEIKKLFRAEDNMNIAFSQWLTSCRFGRPLPIFPALQEEIMKGREACVLVLQSAYQTFDEALLELTVAQKDPAKAHFRLDDVTATKDGVQIRFPTLINRVRRGREELGKRVAEATDLQMDERAPNKVYSESVELLAETQEYTT
jgi:hypothetical protein